VLVVDDHPTYRAVMRDVVDATPGLQMAGDADSGETAIEAVQKLPVDVVLMDKRMPGMGGLEACRAITEGHPDIVVIVCSVEDTDSERARPYGAKAVIRKQDLSPATLRDVLDLVT